jgi:hypothetical protein
VCLFFHQNGREPSLEEMSHSMMSPVVRLRIAAVELPHAKRQIRLWGFQEEMIVVIHQAIGMAEPAIPIDHMGE